MLDWDDRTRFRPGVTINGNVYVSASNVNQFRDELIRNWASGGTALAGGG